MSRDWGVRAGIGNHEKNRALRGSIDEFRIYNYALKSDEIKALVSACKANGGDETAAAQSQSPDITADTTLQEQAASRTSDDKPKVVATSTGPANSDSSSKRKL